MRKWYEKRRNRRSRKREGPKKNRTKKNKRKIFPRESKLFTSLVKWSVGIWVAIWRIRSCRSRRRRRRSRRSRIRRSGSRRGRSAQSNKMGKKLLKRLIIFCKYFLFVFTKIKATMNNGRNQLSYAVVEGGGGMGEDRGVMEEDKEEGTWRKGNHQFFFFFEK